MKIKYFYNENVEAQVYQLYLKWPQNLSKNSKFNKVMISNTGLSKNYLVQYFYFATLVKSTVFYRFADVQDLIWCITNKENKVNKVMEV